MIEIQVEKMADFIDEIQPLLEMHWEEIAGFKDSIKMNPDFELYKTIEEAGGLHSVTVRDNGYLVGYFISLVHKHLHYQDSTWALNDVLFIHPDYRNGLLAYDMFSFAESELKKLGVNVLTIHMTTQRMFDKLVERLGFSKSEVVYAKQLN